MSNQGLSQVFKIWVFERKKKKCLFAFDKISCPKFKSQGEKNHFSKRGSQLSQGTGLLLKMNVVLKGLVI